VLVDAFTDRFTRVGLHMNEIKTKGVIVRGAQAPRSQSLEVFSASPTQGSERACHIWSEHQLEKVQCELCGTMTGQQALRMHQLRKVCEMKRKDWASSEENPANRDVSEDPEVESELETEPMTTLPTPQEYCISIDKVMQGGVPSSRLSWSLCNGESYENSLQGQTY
jgi:hypothetical protein